MAEDDPQMSYMISAWARMCKIMGKDFEQYLPLVMGPVLKAASIKPEVALVDSKSPPTFVPVDLSKLGNNVLGVIGTLDGTTLTCFLKHENIKISFVNKLERKTSLIINMNYYQIISQLGL